jgi:hypothetical protein
MWRVLKDGMAATSYVRVPNPDGEGYAYGEVPDHRARIASVGLAAQLLRMMPESAGVKVDVNTGGQPGDDAINVTASERLSELEAAGGSREPIIAAVEGLLATLKGAAGAGQGAQGAGKA